MLLLSPLNRCRDEDLSTRSIFDYLVSRRFCPYSDFRNENVIKENVIKEQVRVRLILLKDPYK